MGTIFIQIITKIDVEITKEILADDSFIAGEKQWLSHSKITPKWDK